jgi:hypothetical protein
MNFRLSVGLVSLLSSSWLGSSTAYAALGGPSGIVIPYAGKLELDGALVTGSVDFRFDVLEDGATTTVCESKSIRVPVTNGEFAVTIPSVDEACVKGKDVHLQVAVKRDDGTFVVLGKQRVTPVVGAVTSGPGDFAVTGALTADSATLANGLQAASVTTTTLSASSASIGGPVALGTATTGAVTVNGPLKTPGGFFGTLQRLSPPTGGATFSIANGGIGKIHTETAATDGFVMAHFSVTAPGSHLRAQGAVNGEVVQLFSLRVEAADVGGSLMFPVPRGSQWTITWQDPSGNMQPKVYFLPTGQ